MLTKLDRFKGNSARKTCVALLSMLAILLFASAIANAQTIVVSQQLFGADETNSAATYGVSTLPTSGGNWGPASPGGHTAAVNTFGVFVAGTSSGGFAEQFTSQNNVMTVIGDSGINPGGMAIDKGNYLYISGESSNVVYKIPVNTTASGAYGVGTYGPISSVCTGGGVSTCSFVLGTNTGPTATPPPVCAGDGNVPDTAGICQINLGNGKIGFNVASIAVDSSHNLFFTTDGNVGTAATSAPYSVYECNVACLYPTGGATPAPQLLYVEPAASGAQLYTGSIAVDQNDNVYFTDTDISTTVDAGNQYSLYSDLYQLPYNSTTKTYAAAPTLLEKLTPVCATASTTGCSDSDAITTVALDTTGNVYFGTISDGVFKIANNGSALAGNAPVVALSGEGVKTIVPDGKGNFYFVANNPATLNDTAGFLAIGSVVDNAQAWSTEPAGAGSVSNVSAVDQGNACPAQPSLTFGGDPNGYGFTGAVTTGASCNTLPFSSGSNYPVTITFTPTAGEAGPYNTTMTVTNSADADTGSFAVSGVAAVTQTISVTSPSTISPNKVSFGATPANCVAGANGCELEATATSGLPVTFSTTTPTVCSGVSSGVVTFINNGACTVQANQAGNSLYAPAPQVTITFTIAALTQKLTDCTPTTIPFTTTPVPLCVYSSNTTSSAKPVCFTLESGPGTVNGTCIVGQPVNQTVTISGTGKVVLQAAQAVSNGYAAATAVVQIQVNSAPQNVVFTTPAGTLATAPATIVYGSPLTLAATGGASGKPVIFSIDSTTTQIGGTPICAVSGANGVNLAVTGFGSCVVDANQAASDTTSLPSYAAGQAQAFLNVVPINLTTNPVIGPANGSTLYTSGNLNLVTITDAVAGAAIYYTTNGSTPTLSSTPYTAPFALTTAGSQTITAIAIAPGYALSGIATATYTVSATAANFAAVVAPSTVTVSPHSPAVVDITVTSQYGFNSATTFTCSTVPSTLTCSFNPPTVTPAVGQSASTALTLTESSSSTAFQHRSNPFLPAGATFAIAVCFLGLKKRRALFLPLLLIAGAIGVAHLTACASNGSAAPSSSMVVVTATSGKLTQTIQLQVTVNQ